jgi:hypothetical protein
MSKRLLGIASRASAHFDRALQEVDEVHVFAGKFFAFEK